MEVLDQGHTLITPTSRLSRYLQHQYALRQLRAGHKTWPTADVIPWNGWLQRTWEELAREQDLEQILLGAHQQLLIWREVISRSAQGKNLLQPDTTARQAMHAWSLCRQWRIPVFAEDVYLNEDARAFGQWAGAYRQYCEKNGWIDDASLSAVIADMGAPAAGMNNIALAGFDELVPAQRTLFERLQAAGCKVRELVVQARNEQTIAVGMHDCREEIHAAANWARDLLEADPSRCIGIVAHELQALHADMQTIFDDVFFPGAIQVDAAEPQRPYAIAPGLPLSSYPLIDTALLILDLGSETMALEDIGSLLRSPFIRKAEAEGQQRAKLDACLRRHGEHRIAFAYLQWLLKNRYLPAGDVPLHFIECWRRCRDLSREHGKNGQGKKHAAGHWASLFADLLQTCGWPGDRPLNSTEYQTVAEWQKRLQHFSALELVAPLLSGRDALNLLRQLLMNAGFQPETPEVPIQILGVTGAAAMQFDHLWIMGLHAEVWPGKADPDPFIPLKLQRALGMPGATPEIKLAEARNLTQRLISSAPDVVLSYPRNEKERQLRPSPLLKTHLVQAAETVERHPAATGQYARIIYNNRNLEEFTDSSAPPIPPGKVVSGGANLFKDQAACPFRAFARHRLFALALDSRDIGLDAMARGSLVHAVMEKLWPRLRGSQALHDLAPDRLEEINNESVQAAIRIFRKQFPQTFSERFTQLETDRLHAIILQLLELERARRPYTVRHCEYRHQFTFNGITINTRIDRIDQLADGRCVIMDYKTGDPKIGQWFSGRPEEPQLPLYAITAAGQLAAIVFARLHKDGVNFIGLGRENDILPGVRTVADTRVSGEVQDWEALLTGWRETLKRLAADFRQGVAVVDPKSGQSCLQCDLHNFCRIQEKQATSNKPLATRDENESV